MPSLPWYLALYLSSTWLILSSVLYNKLVKVLRLMKTCVISWLIARYCDAWEWFKVLSISKEAISSNTTNVIPVRGYWDDKVARRINISRRSITFSWHACSHVFQKNGRWSPNKELLNKSQAFNLTDWIW